MLEVVVSPFEIVLLGQEIVLMFVEANVVVDDDDEEEEENVNVLLFLLPKFDGRTSTAAPIITANTPTVAKTAIAFLI